MHPSVMELVADQFATSDMRRNLGESYIAVAFGTVTGDSMASFVLSPVTVSQATTR